MTDRKVTHMLKYFIATLLLVVSGYLISPRCFGDEPPDARHIKAEVVGVLRFQEGRGYFISVQGEEFKVENKVWLRISENKIIVKQLEKLTGHDVEAHGYLEQMAENDLSVPKCRMELLDFEIKAIYIPQR